MDSQDLTTLVPDNTVATAQPLLFDSLPADGTPTRRRGRRRTASVPLTAAEPVSSSTIVGATRTGSVTFPPPLSAESDAASPVLACAWLPGGGRPYDPATLTNPELAELLHGLPDLRLSYLLVEAVRELKRRVSPPAWEDGDGDAHGAESPPPNPSLLRAAQLVVAELTDAE